MADRTSSGILPTTSGQSLGNDSFRWNGYFTDADVTGTLSVTSLNATIGNGTPNPGTFTVVNGSVYNAATYAGSDPGAQINAAIAATPDGQVCDARTVSGTLSTTIVLNKPITLLLAGTLRHSVLPAIIVTGSGASGVAPIVRGENAILQYTGSSAGNQMAIGDGSYGHDPHKAEVSGITFNGNGYASAIGGNYATALHLHHCFFLNNAGYAVKLAKGWDAQIGPQNNFNMMAAGSTASLILDECSNTSIEHNLFYPTAAASYGLTFTGVASSCVTSRHNDYGDGNVGFWVPGGLSGAVLGFVSDGDYFEQQRVSPFMVGGGTGNPINVVIRNCQVSSSPASGPVELDANRSQANGTGYGDGLTIERCTFNDDFYLAEGFSDVLLTNNSYRGSKNIGAAMHSIRDHDTTDRMVLGNDTTIRRVSAGVLGVDKVSATTAKLSTVPVYANNAAALAGGLVAGDLYRTGGDPDPLCIVH